MEGDGTGGRSGTPGALSPGWGGPGYGDAPGDTAVLAAPLVLDAPGEFERIERRLDKLERSSKDRGDSVRHFRWFVWAALIWMIVQAIAGSVVCYLVFSTISYLDTARKARDGRDALEEYVACSDLADRASQRPLTQTEMDNFRYLNCARALELPVPGQTPSANQPSPNPTQPSAGTPSPRVSLTPVPVTPSSPTSLVSPQGDNGVRVSPTPSSTSARPAAPTATVTVAPSTPTSSPTRACAVGLLGLCVLS